jgi:hypothetical protein
VHRTRLRVRRHPPRRRRDGATHRAARRPGWTLGHRGGVRPRSRPSDRRTQTVSTFGTTAADLLALRLAGDRRLQTVSGSCRCWSTGSWGSFEPPAPIRELRDLTRHRKGGDPGANPARLSAAQDPGGRWHRADGGCERHPGVSGRAILEALVHGSTDLAALGDVARWALRRKLPALRHALAGRFGPTASSVRRERTASALAVSSSGSRLG